MSEIEKIIKFIDPNKRQAIQKKMMNQSWLKGQIQEVFKEIADANSEEIRANNWNPYVINHMPYKNKPESRYIDFCRLLHTKFTKEFDLPDLPGPDEKRRYSVIRLYAGINGCNTSHMGISVSKILHAYTTFQEIVNYEKIIGKYNDIGYIPTQVVETPRVQEDINASTEQLLKKPK